MEWKSESDHDLQSATKRWQKWWDQKTTQKSQAPKRGDSFEKKIVSDKVRDHHIDEKEETSNQ